MHTFDVYSLLQVRKMNTKIYKIQMLRWDGAMRAMRGEIRSESASSHSEERGGWSKKKRQRGEMMPLRLIESQFGCSILHYH